MGATEHAAPLLARESPVEQSGPDAPRGAPEVTEGRAHRHRLLVLGRRFHH